MKILHVVATMDPKQGGVSEAIRNSIPVQNRLGVETEVLCFDSPKAEFLQREKLDIHPLGPAKGPYAFCKKLTPWLRKNIKRFDVLIIHGLWLHNSFGTYNFWKGYRKEHGIGPKLLVMPHGMLDPYFQKSRKRRLKAIRNWFFWKLIEQKVVNGSDGLLFTCSEEMNLAQKTFYPYKPKAAVTVGLGIKNPPDNCKSFSSEFFQKYPTLQNRRYWLYLSRIHPKKGVDNLLKAYKEIKAENQEIPDLIIAGPGLDTSFGRDILKNSKGLPVYFPGMLEGPAKWGAFYNAEAFVLPSHQENFGIAVVEAMACGKPVLITNKVNIYREIESGQAGLVAEDTREGTYWLLKEWLNMHESRRSALAANARQLFENKFSGDQAAQRMVSSLKDFLEPNLVS